MSVVYDDILDGVVSGIKAINLDDVADANILRQKVVNKQKNDRWFAAIPCIGVAPLGSPTVEPYTHMKDRCTYPVIVVWVGEGNQHQTNNDQRHLEYAERIRRHFLPKGGSVSIQEATSSIIQVRVAPRAMYDIPAWFDTHDVGSLLLNFEVKEGRTNP